MAATATSQALDALRRADDENRARASEIHALRTQIADLQRALEAANDAKARAENGVATTAADLERQTLALNIVLKEVSATKEALRYQREENGRLRASLDELSNQSKAINNMLIAKSATQAAEGGVAHSGPVQYMQYCYTAGADPCLDVLRALHHRDRVIDAKSATFQQLAVLADVIRSDPTAVEHAGAVEFRCMGDHVSVVCDIISRTRGLCRVTAADVDDAASEQLFATLRLQEQVRELELPNPHLNAESLERLWRCLSQRDELAKANSVGAQPLLLRSLDLSQCTIPDPSTALSGLSAQCLGHLSLAGVVNLDKATLRGIVMRCPALSSLVLAGCAKLPNETNEVLNLAPLIRELDVTGCTSWQALRLDHVERLSTTLTGVSAVVMPKLVQIATPVTSFQVAEWNVPQLEVLAMSGLSLGTRECTILSGTQALRDLSIVHCRVLSLDQFLKRMRRLERVSIHGTKGVTDADVRALCSCVVSVDLTDAFLLTDKGLQRFAECPHLKELCLKRCANITDAGIATLEGHESLQQINLLGTKRVSVLAVQKLIECSRSLQRVAHETALSSTVRVDRDDEEEGQKRDLTTQEASLNDLRNSIPMIASPLRPASVASRGGARGFGEAPPSPRRDL